MAEDLIHNKDIYFPSNLGTNEKLITLLNRASQILCDWFSKADKNGPLPFDESFKCIMPAEDGNSEEDLFSEIVYIHSTLIIGFNPDKICSIKTHYSYTFNKRRMSIFTNK